MQKLCPALYGGLLQWYYIPQSCTRYVIEASLSLLQFKSFFAIAVQVNSGVAIKEWSPFSVREWIEIVYSLETPLHSANLMFFFFFTDFIAQGGDPTGTGEGTKHPDSSKSCTWTFLVSFPDPLLPLPLLLRRDHEDETMNFTLLVWVQVSVVRWE